MCQVEVTSAWALPDYGLSVWQLDSEEVAIGAVAVFMAVGTVVKALRGGWVVRELKPDVLDCYGFVAVNC